AASPTCVRPLKPPAENRGQVLKFGPEQPLVLDSGKQLSPFTIAYMTYGTLNAARSDSVLVCHAVSGDKFVASTHPVAGKPGWWNYAVGPGKAIDTNRFF